MGGWFFNIFPNGLSLTQKHLLPIEVSRGLKTASFHVFLQKEASGIRGTPSSLHICENNYEFMFMASLISSFNYSCWVIRAYFKQRICLEWDFWNNNNKQPAILTMLEQITRFLYAVKQWCPHDSHFRMPIIMQPFPSYFYIPAQGMALLNSGFSRYQS